MTLSSAPISPATSAVPLRHPEPGARPPVGRTGILGLVPIPESELTFKTSRSSGPGGQNVNKVETRVTLLFDLDNSPSLDGEQKATIHATYPGRISKQGVLRVTSSKHRSQAANRQAAAERFQALIADALAPKPKRRKTRPPKRSTEKRLEGKRKRSEVKRLRRKPES